MDPQDPTIAQKIVSEYAALLERHTTDDVYPAPVNTLPYPKEVIKTAIQTSVEALISTRQLTEELREFLEITYVSLADYVDGELVRLLTEYRAAGAALAADTRLAKEKVGSPAWTALAQSGRLAGEIAKGIAKETRALRDEFREFCRRLQPGDTSG